MRRCGALWICLAVLLAACQGPSSTKVSLCGPSGSLRVGYVGAAEGRVSRESDVISVDDLEQMRTLMTLASRCDVQFEPMLSPERARQRLQNGEWDLAFLPPGLTAVAMQRGLDHQPVRQLMRRNQSSSALLVSETSPARSLADLNGLRLGLLPRGSLTGFYLPLYNLHGLKFSQVRYANSYDDLLNLLRNGEVDVIAWDAGLADQVDGVRRLSEDSHDIPQGALVLSQSLISDDHKPLLSVLDESAAQMPVTLGYASGVLPAPQTYHSLREIVRHVEGWTLPLEGQPYTVYGGPSTGQTR